MRFKSFLLTIIFSPLLLFSQEIDYGNSVEAADLCVSFKSNSFSSNYDADEALEKILSVVGASKRFMLVSCDNINNALAYTSESGLRYILYDEEFMNSLSSGNAYWSNMAILAHEVGHHINGHTLSEDLSLYESRLEELEADEFAGFVLSKLGADIEVVKEVFREISTDGDDTYSSHPNTTRRLNAITKGYENALNNGDIELKKLSSADEYFYRGYEAMGEGDYSQAVEDFTKVIELEKSSEAYFNRGMSKYNLDDTPGALSDLYRSLELDPEDAQALFWYAEIEYYRNTMTSIYSSISYRLREIEYLQDGSEEMVLARYALGQCYNLLGHYEYALSSLKYANDHSQVISDSYKADIHLALGEVYIELDSLTMAEKHFKSAVELDESNDYLYYSIGFAYSNTISDYLEALKYFDLAINLNNEIPGYFEERSIVYSKLAETKKKFFYQAIFDITQAIELSPENGSYYFYRGNYRNGMGIKGSCDDWLKAIELNYDNKESVIASLVEYCNYSREDFYNNSDWYEIAYEKYYSGDFEAAIDFFSRGILLPGADSRDYYGRGLSYYQFYLFEEALDDFNKSKELQEQKDWQTDLYLMSSLINLNKYDDATAIFDAGINDDLLDFLYSNPETREDFDVDWIRESSDELYIAAEIRDAIKVKKGASLIERRSDLELTQNAFIASLGDAETNVLKNLEGIIYMMEDLIDDEFTFIIKLNTIIDSIIQNASSSNSTLSNLLRIRGDRKLELGDESGACEDYEKALSFTVNGKDSVKFQTYLNNQIRENCR